MKKINIFAASALFLGIAVLAVLPVITGAQASAPTVSSVSPTSVMVNSSATTVTVNGSNFVDGATVSF
jgi:hypothetical protein